MPKPFKGDWEYDLRALAKRPALSARIGEIAYAWTMIDVLLGELLTVMLGPQSRFTTAVYLRLRGARSHALDAVAEEVLSADLLAEFRKIMEKCRKVEDARNDVIHGMWGTDPNNDKVLIWIDPASHVRWQAALATRKGNRSERIRAWVLGVFSKHLHSGMSYDEQDFIDIEKRIAWVFALVFDFTEKVEKQLRMKQKASKSPKSALLKLAQMSGAGKPPPAQEPQEK